MTPQEFVYKWNVTHDFIAALCNCHVTTVDSWINGNFGKSSSQRCQQFKLFIADLILEKYKEMPVFLQQTLCPSFEG